VHKVLALSLSGLALWGASGVALAQANDLQSISSHLKSVSTMTANFSQTDRAGKTVTGKMTLARPGRIRFQYEPSIPLLLVSDGKALTFIDYSVKQVQRWPISSSPLSVLLDPDRDISRYARIVPSGNAGTVVAEVRDPKRPEFGVISLAFTRESSAPAGLRLLGWVALDSQNNRTTIRLSDVRFNTAVSGEAFKWRDPRSRNRGR
jgi:outer membrane lipoprotein-sorting protein